MRVSLKVLMVRLFTFFLFSASLALIHPKPTEAQFLPRSQHPVAVLRNFPVWVSSEFLPSFGVSDPLPVQAVVTGHWAESRFFERFPFGVNTFIAFSSPGTGGCEDRTATWWSTPSTSGVRAILPVFTFFRVIRGTASPESLSEEMPRFVFSCFRTPFFESESDSSELSDSERLCLERPRREGFSTFRPHFLFAVEFESESLRSILHCGRLFCDGVSLSRKLSFPFAAEDEEVVTFGSGSLF